MLSILSAISILVFSLLHTFTHAECFNPDGSAAPSHHQPCNPGRPSMCCPDEGLSWGSTACNQNGLCNVAGTYYRQSCTDQSWKDPACLPLCTPGKLGQYAQNETGNQDTPITSCTDGSYCCGLNNTDCCDSKAGFWILNSVYAYDGRPSANNTETVTTSILATPTAATAIESSSSKADPRKDVKKIALGVGIGVGIPLLMTAALIAVLLFRNKPGGMGMPPSQYSEIREMQDMQ